MTVADGDFAETMIHPSLDTVWWWEALDRGELLVPTCRTCNKRFFPPQAFCPRCGSTNWIGGPTAGTGRVYSWVVTYHPFTPDLRDEVPYAIVAVDLDDGGRLIGRYEGNPADMRDGLPVRFTLLRRGPDPVLSFAPVHAAPASSNG